MKTNKLRQNYKQLYSKVQEILFRNDPIGINFEENKDEYDPEVSTILPRLKDANSEEDVINIVYEEFTNWFGADTAGDLTTYKEAAKEIWTAWNEFITKTTEHANQPDAE
jgi:hypothetical protein